jgi:hypothetical protein
VTHICSISARETEAEDHEFKASLGFIAGPPVSKRKKELTIFNIR